MKGILLAGGAGTRLYPLTAATSKQLLPVYDKPMIYYPLSVLMRAGIRQILLVCTPEDMPRYARLLGGGERFGVKLSYVAQPSPDGLTQALLLGEEFIGDDACAMALGDNIFCGDGLDRLLAAAVEGARRGRATILGCRVPDPARFGVVELGAGGEVLSVEEKPATPRSDCCVTGLYFYPRGVSRLARGVEPSARGELEILALSELYLKRGLLDVRLLDGGIAWLDAGTVDSLAEASELVRRVEGERGVLVGSPEEVAYRRGWIGREALLEAAGRCGGSPYGARLRALAEERIHR